MADEDTGPVALAAQGDCNRSAAFPSLVVGGGGARCFWSAGVLHSLREEIGYAPQRVSAVSAGALVAASFVAGNGERLREIMHSEFRRLDHNVRWPGPTQSRLLPHLRAYRRAILQAFDADALQALLAGPPVTVQIARPAFTPARPASFLAGLVHEAERHVRGTPHGRWCQRLGFRPEIVPLATVQDAGDLTDLLLATGSIPPFIPVQTWRGRPCLDGSLLDNAPVTPILNYEERGERTLVLVSRRYPNLPNCPNRTYLAPSRHLPADKLDFTDTEAIGRAFDLGCSDGREFIRDNC